MYNGKKITKEDTWRSADLIKHVQGHEDESRRTERSHRDPEKEKRRNRERSARRGEARDEREESRRGEARDERDKERRRGEARDERHKEARREEVRDGKDKESRRGESGKERNKESRRREAREERGIESRRERERDRGESRHRDGEKEEQREKYKEPKKERDGDGDGLKERDKARDREKDREREKRHRQRDRLIEKEGDRGEEKDKEREKRRKEREHERRTEKRVSLTVYDTSVEREKERKERQREREQRRGGEEQERKRTERERREKHRQNTGHTDGDKRRERQKIETEQRSQSNHDGTTEGAKESDKRREKLKEVKHEVLEESGGGGADYEDDFEDYEEDFEEFDEERDEESSAERDDLSPHSRREVELIQKAMEKENELHSTTHSTSSTQESDISVRASAESTKSRTYGRVIDFTAARQRNINQQTAEKQRNRSVELLRLIDLDFSVTESFLDVPPVREYDLYIKSYGMANTKQAYVQSNEDNTERDTQTDETELVPKWTQHPPESSVVCGGPQVSQNASAVTATTEDSKRLAAFLSSAAQVMAVLLEENVAESNSVKNIQSQMQTHSFSDGCVQLNTQLNLLQGRQVTLLHFSQTQTHTLLSVHALCSGSSDVTPDIETLICVWNIWEPSTPQKILVYDAEVRSCCFSPGKATLVFAGTDVGSVLVWDLREPSSSHTHIGVCEEAWPLRHPTFSTDAVLSGVGHFSSVVSVEPVPLNMGAGLRDPLLSEQEGSLGLSFQLGSLDGNGLLNLWVVVELPKADESGSQTDLGLRPGGKVKLLHSSSLQTTPQVDKLVPGVKSLMSSVLKFLPSDSNHYFIGSNMGLVRHGTRHGLRAVPKLYTPEDGERPAEVTALDFCSTGEPFFLVGCSDGSVRLHALACAEAVCEWTLDSGRGSVRCVGFSPTRCPVFCALDSASVLHIWNLAQRDDSALVTHDFSADPVSAMTVFGDAARKNPYSGIALAKRSGTLEIHFLIPLLTLPQASDVEILRSLTRDTL